MSARHQLGEVHLGAVEVVAGRQAGLEHHDRRRRLGQHVPVELDPDRAGRAQRVDPGVRVAGMDEDLLVLLVPGVQRVPLEPRRPGQPRQPRRRRRPGRAPGRVTSPTCSPCRRAVPRLSFCVVLLVDQHARGRRRRPGCSTAGSAALPHVAAPRGVQHDLARPGRPGSGAAPARRG